MSQDTPRLVIADPSLIDARGHHFSLTMQITGGARELGVDVMWLAHRDFAIADIPGDVRVCPLFSATMYDRYRPEKKNSLPSDLDRRLLDELRLGITQCDIKAEDHIYFHTGFGDLFRALPGYASTGDWRQLPYLHVCTPYDHNTMPGKDPGSAVLDVLRSLRTYEAVDKKLFFWAETPQLARYYVRTYGFNVRPMPLPAPHGVHPGAAEKDVRPLTALYLGAAREEKGFLHLPELAEQLHEKYGRSGRLRFVIQCTPQIIGYLPHIRAAIERLRALPSGYVELIDDVMDEQDYHARLAASDIVLLLYNQKSYRIRGSGIAVEAICADRCLLTHRDTFCASLLTHGGGESVNTVEQAVSSLARMVDEIDQFRSNARLQGQAYRASNSVSRYVRRILGCSEKANMVPFFPSAFCGHIHYPLLRVR